MQRPDEHKRREILKVAEKLFASKPFHEVKLDHIAARAKIGKGTIYIYFKSKDDVYLNLLRQGLREQLARLQGQVGETNRNSCEDLRLIVEDLVTFTASRPSMGYLLRASLPGERDEELVALRKEFVALIAGVIRRGIARNEMCDSRPELTAQFLLSSIRGGMAHLGNAATTSEFAEHIMQIYGKALSVKAKEK